MSPRAGLLHLCLLYGLGLAVDLFASGMPNWAKLAVLLFGVIISFVVYYSQFYQPALRLKDDYLRLLLPDLFEALARKYWEEWPGEYELRINVMRVRRKSAIRQVEGRWVVAPRYLRLDFTWGTYTEAEREQEYLAGVGCAGLALALNRPVIFDAAEAQEPRLSLTATQRQVTEHVHSILSIPIHRPSDQEKRAPVGVLNLDSRNPIAETGFRQHNLQQLARTYAALIGAAVP